MHRRKLRETGAPSPGLDRTFSVATLPTTSPFCEAPSSCCVWVLRKDSASGAAKRKGRHLACTTGLKIQPEMVLPEDTSINAPLPASGFDTKKHNAKNCNVLDPPRGCLLCDEGQISRRKLPVLRSVPRQFTGIFVTTFHTISRQQRLRNTTRFICQDAFPVLP